MLFYFFSFWLPLFWTSCDIPSSSTIQLANPDNSTFIFFSEIMDSAFYQRFSLCSNFDPNPRLVLLETSTQAKFSAESLACVDVSNRTSLGLGSKLEQSENCLCFIPTVNSLPVMLSPFLYLPPPSFQHGVYDNL